MNGSTFTETTEEFFLQFDAEEELFLFDRSVNGVDIAPCIDERSYHLRMGFKLGADKMFEFAKTYPNFRKKLIYPILFCYRHYIEITLKNLLEEYGPRKSMDSVEPNHKLDILWKKIRELHHKYDIDPSQCEEFFVLEKLINKFAKIDPNSELFRYPADKKGNRFQVRCDRINFLHLFEEFERIYNYLGALDWHLNSLLEQEDEYCF